MVSLHDVGSREIRMEQCWNDTDRKTEASEIKLSEYYVVHHESHIVSSTEINITCEKIYFFFCVANKILHIGKGENKIFNYSFLFYFYFCKTNEKLIVSVCFSVVH